MILRALFWIAVVAIFMPHEPDLGLGRPGAIDSAPLAQIARPVAGALGGTNAVRGVIPVQACADHAQICGTVLADVDRAQEFLVGALENVRAQLETRKDKSSPAGM